MAVIFYTLYIVNKRILGGIYMEERNNMCFDVDMSKEEWRDVKGFEGLYQVSNWGRIKGKRKILKLRDDGSLGLAKNGIIYNRYAKRLVAEAFIPNFNENKPVMNLDGNCMNNRLDNIVNRVSFGSNQNPPLNTTLHITDLKVYDTPIIEGGFGQGSRIIFDITLAKQINKSESALRTENILPILHQMCEGIDYIDLKKCGDADNYIPLLLELGYTKQGLTQVRNIFILSERGVAKVMSTLRNSNSIKWKFLNNFVNEYFNMREQIKNQVPQIDIRTQAIIDIVNASASGDAVQLGIAIGNFEKNITAPLLDTIEKQAPKVDKFDRYMESDGTYNATNTAKLLNISSAQKFNNLLKDRKIQYRTGKNWVLYSKYQWLIDEGYCKYIEGENSNYSYIQLRWYPKGVDWLRTQIQEQVI